MNDRSRDEAMAELFREDSVFATECLNQLIQDGEPADLLMALRQMAQASGSVYADSQSSTTAR
jgi:DNA-binding phage protein